MNEIELSFTAYCFFRTAQKNYKALMKNVNTEKTANWGAIINKSLEIFKLT